MPTPDVLEAAVELLLTFPPARAPPAAARPSRVRSSISVADRRRQVLQQGDVPLRPEPRRFVDHAQGSDGVALASDQRHAGVRDPAQLPDDGVVPEQRMTPGILQHQRLSGGDHLPAEGEGDRV